MSSGAPPALVPAKQRSRTDREKPTRPDAAAPDSTQPRTAGPPLADCRRCGCRRRIESSCRSTRISSSFDLGDRQQSVINSNRRRTTKYASDHNTRDLHQTGKPTLAGHCLSDLPDRVFEPHALMVWERWISPAGLRVAEEIEGVHPSASQFELPLSPV